MGEPKARISGEEVVVKGERQDPGAWDRPYGDVRPYQPGASRYPVGEIHVGSGFMKPVRVGREVKTLAQIILESPDEDLDYLGRTWRRILSLDKSFAEDTIKNTPINIVSDVVRVLDLGGPFLKEFLKPDLTEDELKRLDRVKRYWSLVNRARAEKTLDQALKAIDGGYEFSYTDENGNEKKAKVIGICDGRLVEVAHYRVSTSFGYETVLGSRYRDLCSHYEETIASISQRLDELAEILKKDPGQEAISEIEAIAERLRRIREYEDEIIRTPFQAIAFVEDRYVMKVGKLSKHPLYMNYFQFTCPLCEKEHKLWVVIKG